MKIVLNVIGVLLILPGIILFPARHQCPARQFYDGPDSVGYQWRNFDCCGRGPALVCKSSALIVLSLSEGTRRIGR